LVVGGSEGGVLSKKYQQRSNNGGEERRNQSPAGKSRNELILGSGGTQGTDAAGKEVVGDTKLPPPPSSVSSAVL